MRSAGLAEELYRKYHSSANIRIVYTREAHPYDPGEDATRDVMTERRRNAASMVRQLGLSIPVLLDTADDQAESQFMSTPTRTFVLDANGRFAFTGSRANVRCLAEDVPGVLDRLLKRSGETTS